MVLLPLTALWATYRRAPLVCSKEPECHCRKRDHFYEYLIKLFRTLKNDSYILRMPDEILCPIFEDVARLDRKLAMNQYYYTNKYRQRQVRQKNRPRRGQVDVEGQYALALTCRRFHRLVMPLLCGKVVLDSCDPFHRCAPQKDLFLKSLDESPWLQLYITDLTVKWNELTMASREIRSLIKLPNLQRLTLDSLNIYPGELDLGPLPEEKRTANLSTLKFLALRARPRSIRRLLEWPRALHSLDLNIIAHRDDWLNGHPDSLYWTPDRLADVLRPQRESLHELKLGWLGFTFRHHKFTTWPYPKLHTFTVSVTNSRPSSSGCARWISPSLRTLILDAHFCCCFENDFYSLLSELDILWTLDNGAYAGRIKRQGGRQLERIGVRVFAEDRSCREALFEKERANMHEDREKHKLAVLLEALQKHGFSTFWIGASGAEYTAEEMRESCKCANCIA